ncbi:transketolase [bacterium]|nr:MAG: transketolase [bacterium]
MVKKYKEIAKSARSRLIKMHAASGASHIASSLSVTDILVALYFNILRVSPEKPKDKNRDRLILSKGHAASALFTCLAARGFFPQTLLEEYCIDGGRLPGHASINCVPGLEVSTGSLGHGLSIGVGMALAAKYDREKYRVFVVLSDGECQEGAVWEAAMFAGHHKLDNIIAIIDYNKMQALGKSKEILNLEPLAKKWQSFGWAVKETGGHDIEAIIKTLKKVPFAKNKPSVLIAHTTKGKGVSFMENKLLWHYKSPDREQAESALGEIGCL